MSMSHRVGRMPGRDPHEAHRTSTPLELLFDLTFAVAFSQISTQAAHYLETGHVKTALVGFGFTIFGAVWAWINYSWFASAAAGILRLEAHRSERGGPGGRCRDCRPDRGLAGQAVNASQGVSGA